MAGSLNKVLLIGRLGADPEIKQMVNGKSVARLSLATSQSWKDKNTGEKKEKTEWHRVSLFGKLAEIAGQYLDKGSKVYVEGKLQTRSYEQDGVKKYATDIVVSGFNGTLQMLDRRDDAGGASRPAATTPQATTPAQDPITPVDNAGFDDDIPF